VRARLLCATDGSKPSQKAVEWASEFARTLGAHLSFLTVNTVSPERAAKTHFWDETLLAAAEAQTHKELRAAADAAARAGLTDFACVTASGRDIPAAIVDYAEKNGFNHIIMGSNGHSGAARLLLGSVAAAVVARAHCPVTVVR